MPAAVEKLLDNLAWTEVQKLPGTPEGMPYPTHEGAIDFGGMVPGGGKLRCYKLSTGERVFDARDVARMFGAPVP